MENSNVECLKNLPENVKILTFIGSRSSPELRYLLNYFTKKELNNSTNPINFYFKWSSFIQENALRRIQRLFEIPDNDESEPEIEEFQLYLKQQKPIRFIIAMNLNDYENLTIDEMTSLQAFLKISSKIFYFCFDDKNYFNFCITERISRDDFYNFKWPSYVSFSKILLNYLSEQRLDSKLILLNSLDTLKFIIKKIENSPNSIPSDLSTYVTKQMLYNIIQTVPFKKTSQFIKDLIKCTKARFRLKLTKEIEVDFQKFFNLNSENEMLILGYLNELYESRELYSFEEKSVFKNYFVNGSGGGSSSFLTILNKYIIQVLSREKNLEKWLNVLLYSVGIISILSRHLIFKHGVFNNELYVPLIYNLLECESKILNYEATGLLSQILTTDYKRYGNFFVDYDKKHSKSITLLIYNIIFEFYQKYTDANVEETTSSFENKMLYDTIHIESLEYCLKFGNCHQLTNEHIENLFNLCVYNRFLPYKRIKTDLYGILHMLLKYGPNDVWLKRNNLRLILKDIYKTMDYLLESNFTKNKYWSRTSAFFKEILAFVQKNPQYEYSEADLSTFEAQEIITLIDRLNPEMMNTLNSEHLEIINEKNQDFLIKYTLQACAESEYNLHGLYVHFLYRSQHYYSKDSLIFGLKSSLTSYSYNMKKGVKILKLMGELIIKDVLGENLIESVINEWYDKGLFKLAIGLKALINDKLNSKLFDKFLDTSEKLGINLKPLNHENLDDYLNDLFEIKAINLVKRYHENFISFKHLDLDFRTEYERTFEMNKMDILELKSQNENLKKNKLFLENELEFAKNELKRLEIDRQNKIKEINDLRNQNLTKTKIVSKIEIKAQEPNYQAPQVILDNSKIDLDLIEDELSLNKIDENLTSDLCRQILDTLKFKRRTFKEFRSLIRGSLKHLSVNLYTSPYQFLSEIIQNFEDTEYDNSSQPWYMKIIIDKDYLIFCNNEIGFKAKDIKSICSCSESSKQKGKHIGHKGLGFKSVFLCSDNPVIVSKKWQFEFRKENDEISFITPHFLDQIPSQLEKFISNDTTSNTFIYLPLKEDLKYIDNYSKSEKYFNDIHQNVDPNILLFTNKIKKLYIVNKIKNSETIIECLNSSGLNSHLDYEFEEKLIKIENLESKVKLFRKKILIPENLVESEELTSNQTELTIGFPEGSVKKCKIFAFLPICDLNFNFLMNTSWILVTNRETINLNSSLNSFYRDQMAEFFIQIIKTQVDLRHNILEYIPKNFILLNDFWKQFVTDLKYGLKSIISENLNFDKELKTYVFNEDLRLLLTDNFTSNFRIKLINSNESGIDYEYYGFNKINLSIILDHMTLNDCQSLDDDWWINFYRHLDLNFSSEIKAKCLKSNIFLIGNERTNILESNKFYLLIDDSKQIKSWRTELVLIDYKSQAERNFLSNHLKIPKITNDYLKNYIKNLHLDYTNLGSLSLIWEDLNFIKNNYPNELLVLYVPTLCGNLRPIHECYLSQIIGYDLKNLTTCKYLIDFKFTTLDWEIFFIRQKCKFPKLDQEENKIDQIFTGFSIYESQDLKYINEILGLIEGYKIKDFLFGLPVKSKYLNDDSYVTFLSKTCLSTVYDGYLPSIDIPSNMYEIAEKLGVSVKLNYAKCIKVLRNLVFKEVNNPSVYIDWFLNMKSNYDNQSIPDVELITLEDGKSYKLSNLYCCESTPGLKLICKYLNKGLINFESNSVFKPIETILILFGAKIKPSFEDCIKCLNFMIRDYDIFNNKSRINCLSSYGYEDVYQMFYTLEIALRSELGHGMTNDLTNDYDDIDQNDLDKRENIINLVRSRMEDLEKKYGVIDIPIVTYDNHMFYRNECESNTLAVCFQSDFLLVLTQKFPHFLFLNQLIFKKCPYVLGLINAEYLTKYINIYLQHINSNIEEANPYITKIFREASGIQDLQVAKANYIGLRIKPKSEEDDSIEADVAFNTIKYAIFKKQWVYLSCNDYSSSNLAISLTHALKSLLKSLNPNKSDDVLNSEAKEFISKISKSNLESSNWRAWEYSCTQVSIFDLNQIIFAEDELDSNQFCEVFFSSNKTSSDDFNKMLKSSFISDHECYMQSFSTSLNDVKINDKIEDYVQQEENLVPFEANEVNYEKQKKCSIKAEHYFCCYLKSIYGDQFNEYKDWVSSARNIVYPSNLYKTNDSLGYDFKIVDHKNIFSLSHGSNKTESNTCFIEVKGTERNWDGKFHISQNEINKKVEINQINERRDKDQRYVVVIIEWVSNPQMTRIAMIINWSENDSIVRVTPESYLATYTPEFRNKHEIGASKNYRGQERRHNRQEMEIRNENDSQARGFRQNANFHQQASNYPDESRQNHNRNYYGQRGSGRGFGRNRNNNDQMSWINEYQYRN